jgi:hypothetical protein
LTTPPPPPAPRSAAVPPPPAAPGPLPDAVPDWTPTPASGGAADAPSEPVPASFGEGNLDWTLRLLGALLAVAVTDPAGWFSGSPSRLLVPVFVVLGALFAAGPVAFRPVADDRRWQGRLSRFRNTLFVAACVLLAAAIPPPGWLAACDTALLLSYLLLLDAVVGGPPAAGLLRRPLALVSVYAGCAVVLAGALLPIAATGAWARLVAALALSASAVGVLTALRLRHRPASGPTRRPR